MRYIITTMGKRYTEESWERLIKGNVKGGHAPKKFTEESKRRQVEGGRKGGKQSKDSITCSKNGRLGGIASGISRRRKTAEQ